MSLSFRPLPRKKGRPALTSAFGPPRTDLAAGIPIGIPSRSGATLHLSNGTATLLVSSKKCMELAGELPAANDGVRSSIQRQTLPSTHPKYSRISMIKLFSLTICCICTWERGAPVQANQPKRALSSDQMLQIIASGDPRQNRLIAVIECRKARGGGLLVAVSCGIAGIPPSSVVYCWPPSSVSSRCPRWSAILLAVSQASHDSTGKQTSQHSPQPLSTDDTGD